ncbi:MAG: hypothetical protein K2J82_00745 [Muribaculaceae bacterium]|nr:hypothetical protein [Muribaculaceae bacterium]MDE6753121.1 hypothetical protein [Muribaculaceae bacterium]
MKGTQPTQTEKRFSIWTTCLALISIIPFLFLSNYVYPVNDDYFFSLLHIDTNPFQATFETWQSWSGRYLATFISSLNPLAMQGAGMPYFKYWSLIGIFLFTASWFIMTTTAFRKLSILRRICLASIMMLCYLALFPSISQGFYWFSAYTAYTFPSLLFLIYIGLLGRKNIFCKLAGYLLALLIPGGNEVLGVAFLGTLAYIALFYPSRRNNISFFIGLAGLLFVIFSPGNGIRLQHQLSTSPYLWTLAVSFAQTISWFFIWLPILLIGSLLYIPLIGRYICEHKVFNIPPILFVISFLIILFLSHIPATFGLSTVVIDRTANTLLFFFIVSYFYGLTLVLRYHRDWLNGVINVLQGKIMLVISLFCFLMTGAYSINSPVATAITDLVTGKAAAYARIQQARIDSAESSQRNDTVIFKPLGLTSRSLFVKELDTNPDGDFSNAFCKVNGIKGKVAVEKEEVYFEDNFTALKNFSKGRRK